MTEFEAALQECLRDLELGNSDVQDCLKRYPNYAQQLELVLLTSQYLQQGSKARLSEAFKMRVRNKLLQQMYAHPRKPARSQLLFWRLAGSLAFVIVALLVAGTAYAQNALPGSAFYPWKLTSETAWRSVSADPVGTDLAIAERRVNELIAIRNNPAVYSETLNAYLEVVDRLNAEINPRNEARIREALDSQFRELNHSSILLTPGGQDVVPTPGEPTAVPLSTPDVAPLPVLETPQANPTKLPEIVPTVQVPSKIIPTKDVLPKIVPTLEVPPPIP